MESFESKICRQIRDFVSVPVSSTTLSLKWWCVASKATVVVNHDDMWRSSTDKIYYVSTWLFHVGDGIINWFWNWLWMSSWLKIIKGVHRTDIPSRTVHSSFVRTKKKHRRIQWVNECSSTTCENNDSTRISPFNSSADTLVISTNPVALRWEFMPPPEVVGWTGTRKKKVERFVASDFHESDRVTLFDLGHFIYPWCYYLVFY